MTLEELLRTSARDVADGAPETFVAISDIRARAGSVRRRQRAGLAAGMVAATAAVALGVQAVGGDGNDAPQPLPPAPSPSSTESQPDTVPGEPVAEVVDVDPDDLRDYEELATRTNVGADGTRATEVTFEVSVGDLDAYEWSHFCSGDPDTWYVIIVGDNGASGSGYCNQTSPEPFPTFPTDISPFGHSGNTPATQVVRMWVVDEIPEQHQKCFDRKSPPECLDIDPPLEPLASTDVTFGVSVYEYLAPAVTQVLGYDLAARASVEGTDYLLSRVLTPADGQHAFSATLPASEGDRVVVVLDNPTDALRECELAAGADREAYEACEAVVAIDIGDRTVPLVRGEFGDFPAAAGPGASFLVPAGEDEVGMHVHSGDPDHVDFALVVFDQAP